MLEILIRKLHKEDEAFVYATYLRNHWFSKDNKTTLPKDTFMKLLHNRVASLIDDDKIEIACLNEDPDVIIGYAVKENPIKSFVYVKRAFRNQGIESLLLERNLNREKH